MSKLLDDIREYGLAVMDEASRRPGGIGAQKNWYHFVAGATIRDRKDYGSPQQLIEFLLDVMRGTFDGLHGLWRVEICAEHIAHLKTMLLPPNPTHNVEWEQKRQTLLEARATFPEDCTCDAIRLPDGTLVRSPYEHDDPARPVISSEEARRYIGQTGTIVSVSFQQRHLRMEDGAMLILLVPERRKQYIQVEGARA